MNTQNFDESKFIRETIYSAEDSQLRKYARLVNGETSLIKLFKYEFITSIFGSIPGALGLVLRKLFYPMLFKKSGKGVLFGRNLIIRNAKNISLGDNVIIDDHAFLDGRGAGDEGLTIGDNTIIGRNAIIHSKAGPVSIGSNCNIGESTIIIAQGGIKIGEWAQIAGGCKISGGLFKLKVENDDKTPFDRYSKGEIIIGEKCFIGMGVMITDGIKIGKKSVIGTGSTVMSNIPEHSVYMPKPGMIVGTTSQD